MDKNIEVRSEKESTEFLSRGNGIQTEEGIVQQQQTPNSMNKSNGVTAEEEEDMEDESGNDDDGTEQEDDTSSQVQKASPLTAQQRARHAITGRGVTLAMLMEDHVIEPGENNMSIDYLGQKFTADLLSDGQIRWREEDKIFGSPSAWALHCKKIVNPSKKSGCGWASVRYKGKKLDVYKSSWVRKQKPALSSLVTHSSDGLREDAEEGETEGEENECKKIKLDTEEDTTDNECDNSSIVPPSMAHLQEGHRASVKHCTLGRRSNAHDQTTMVECHSFTHLGRIQPFNVKFSTNALLLMDLHCHLTSSEIVGYLGGKWDGNTQYLMVKQAFPCKCRLADRENAVNVENEIRCDMESRDLTLVGWYHSHPKCQPDPSLKDIEAQMEYQVQLKGVGSMYHPCMGIIFAPYDAHSPSKESQMRTYWIMPPPEQRPLDYGMPMNLQYEITQNESLPDNILLQMKQLVEFYKDEPDLIDVKAQWTQSLTYLEKLKISLKKKLPKQEGVWEQIEELLTGDKSTNPV